MDIRFRTAKLQKIFNEEKRLNREYGNQMARKIMMRMAVLEAAEDLSLVPREPPPRCHQLTADRRGQFAVDLEQPYRLIFEPANKPLPRLEDGGIDLTRVTEIEIIEVDDYN